MTLNINSKEVLAKLLATENIDIVHGSVDTASFNVKDRILTLPLWEDMKDFTYDHLVGHEVGHALWTDADKWQSECENNPKNFKTFLNVVEDARIEKLIQRRYPGLRSSFIKSYKKLLAEGLFGKDADQINNYKLIDRLNVLFKCGQTVGVKIEKDEKVWVDKMASLETFDDAIKVAHELFELAKAEHQEEKAQAEAMADQMMMMQKEENEVDDGDFEFDDEDGDDDFEDYQQNLSDDGWGDDETDEDGDSSSSEDSDDDSESDDGGDDGDSGDADSSSLNNSGSENSDDDITSSNTESVIGKEGGENDLLDPDLPISETDRALEENIKTEYSSNTKGSIDIKNFKLNLKEKEITERIKSYKDILKDVSENADMINAGMKMYKEFQVNNKKTINYLVKEFEMKKKAAEYKRATVSKTGVIDTLKMNNYKFSDDIFKKMTIVPDGKNHGLIMFIDWSGSMASQLANTVDQLLNLVSFCRQVQIPFQVYAFSDNNDGWFSQNLEKANENQSSEMHRKNETAFSSNFHLLEFFNNKMSRTEFQKAAATVLAIGKYWENRYRQNSKYGHYYVQRRYWLSGTPLNDAIVSAHTLVTLFQKTNRLDVVNTVFLTDGGSHPLYYWSHFEGDARLGKSYVEQRYGYDRKSRHCFVNPITKKQYRLNYNEYYSGDIVTRTLLKSLADFTKTNVIGFHILPNRKPSAMSEMPRDMKYNMKESAWTEMKKEKFTILSDRADTGYTTQFAVLGTDLQTSNGSIEVSDTATTAQIRQAFRKANKGKKSSRLMLSKFIDLVA